MKFCEFTGDELHDFDEVGYKKKCEHIGLIPNGGMYMCMKYRLPIRQNNEGWLRCCSICEHPIHVFSEVTTEGNK